MHSLVQKGFFKQKLILFKRFFFMSLTKLNFFGYKNELFKKHALFFVLIQFAIWFKVVVFYVFFGKGVLYPAPFLPPAFFVYLEKAINSGILGVIDFGFHTLMHLLIALIVLLFSFNAKKLPFTPLLFLAITGSVLHNIGYWFTNVFSSPSQLALDFVSDALFLVFFVYFFSFLARHLNNKKLFQNK